LISCVDFSFHSYVFEVIHLKSQIGKSIEGMFYRFKFRFIYLMNKNAIICSYTLFLKIIKLDEITELR